MKIITYHYVRNYQADLPSFTYLHQEHFAKQVRYFKRDYGLTSLQHFIEWSHNPDSVSVPTGVVLTFDDGLRDHYDFVAPVLADEGAWGLFFVPTAPFESASLLPVHQVHVLLGHLGAARCLQLLEESACLRPQDIKAYLSSSHGLYQTQPSSEFEAKAFKYFLNYALDYKTRFRVLEVLRQSSRIDIELWEQWEQTFYMSCEMLRALSDAGHLVGSHSVSHRVLSQLSPEEQRSEIVDSQSHLVSVLDLPIFLFSYPYGGPTSFSIQTQSIVREAKYEMAFCVDQREVRENFLNGNRFKVSRVDCNQFPYGVASTSRVDYPPSS